FFSPVVSPGAPPPPPHPPPPRPPASVGRTAIRNVRAHSKFPHSVFLRELRCSVLKSVFSLASVGESAQAITNNSTTKPYSVASPERTTRRSGTASPRPAPRSD